MNIPKQYEKVYPNTSEVYNILLKINEAFKHCINARHLARQIYDRICFYYYHTLCKKYTTIKKISGRCIVNIFFDYKEYKQIGKHLHFFLIIHIYGIIK